MWWNGNGEMSRHWTVKKKDIALGHVIGDYTIHSFLIRPFCKRLYMLADHLKGRERGSWMEKQWLCLQFGESWAKCPVEWNSWNIFNELNSQKIALKLFQKLFLFVLDDYMSSIVSSWHVGNTSVLFNNVVNICSNTDSREP